MTALWESITTVISAMFSVFDKYPLYLYLTDLETTMNAHISMSAIDGLFFSYPFNVTLDNETYIGYTTSTIAQDIINNPTSYYNWLFILLFSFFVTFVVIAAFRKILKSST